MRKEFDRQYGKVHLSDENMAVAVDSLRLKGINNLDIKIKDHLRDCSVCSLHIMVIAQIVENIENKNNPRNLAPENLYEWLDFLLFDDQ